jgi:hypothetical protein
VFKEDMEAIEQHVYLNKEEVYEMFLDLHKNAVKYTVAAARKHYELRQEALRQMKRPEYQRKGRNR